MATTPSSRSYNPLGSLTLAKWIRPATITRRIYHPVRIWNQTGGLVIAFTIGHFGAGAARVYSG